MVKSNMGPRDPKSSITQLELTVLACDVECVRTYLRRCKEKAIAWSFPEGHHYSSLDVFYPGHYPPKPIHDRVGFLPLGTVRTEQAFLRTRSVIVFVGHRASVYEYDPCLDLLHYRAPSIVAYLCHNEWLDDPFKRIRLDLCDAWKNHSVPAVYKPPVSLMPRIAFDLLPTNRMTPFCKWPFTRGASLPARDQEPTSSYTNALKAICAPHSPRVIWLHRQRLLLLLIAEDQSQLIYEPLAGKSYRVTRHPGPVIRHPTCDFQPFADHLDAFAIMRAAVRYTGLNADLKRCLVRSEWADRAEAEAMVQALFGLEAEAPETSLRLHRYSGHVFETDFGLFYPCEIPRRCTAKSLKHLLTLGAKFVGVQYTALDRAPVKAVYLHAGIIKTYDVIRGACKRLCGRERYLKKMGAKAPPILNRRSRVKGSLRKRVSAYGALCALYADLGSGAFKLYRAPSLVL